MNRRTFIQLGSCASAALTLGASGGYRGRRSVAEVDLAEATISELNRGFDSGQFSAVSLAKRYLSRIHEIDKRGPAVNSIIELNPDALADAARLDKERKAKGPRGPFHGIPVLVKDNIDTAGKMRTTAGSLALRDWSAPDDAPLVGLLRKAGTVILGKTNLSEWANFRSGRSTSGWSARGGLTKNPYALNRNPSGSSSGSAAAVSANLCSVAVGTETDGSILSPSSVTGVVALKPTVGLISGAGIIPISASQDTAGPMSRCVYDCASLLTVLAGSEIDYASGLDAGALKGARIGVCRQFAGFHATVDKVFQAALEAMRSGGATLTDAVDLPRRSTFGQQEFEVMLYEFKDGLNKYLSGLPAHIPVHSLADLIRFNEDNADVEMPYFGQEILVKAEAKGPLTESAYIDAKSAARKVTREGIDNALKSHNVEAIVVPTTGPAHLTDFTYGDRGLNGSTSAAATAGYPSITVPAGFVNELPIGLSFISTENSEKRLIKLAYAFEQATKARKPPKFLAGV